MFKRSALLFMVLVAGVVNECPAGAGVPGDEEKNLATMKRFYDEVVNKGNLALIDELVATDFVDHEEFPGMKPERTQAFLLCVLSNLRTRRCCIRVC